MIELAETADAESRPLPDPHLIWLKAQIRRRSEDLEHALLPIKIGGALSAIGVAAILASIPRETWSWTYEWVMIGSTLVSGLPNLLSLSPIITPWIAAGLLVIVLLFAASDA